jgi:small-conductance mechanosensitive channel
VYVGDLNDNGVSLTVLAWTKKEDFGVVKNEIAEKIQTLIDGRNIVFPQTSALSFSRALCSAGNAFELARFNERLNHLSKRLKPQLET